MAGLSADAEAVAVDLRGQLEALGADGPEWSETAPGTFTVDLPGTRKLLTSATVVVGRHAVGVHAFVCRRPDENHEAVYRWMLERNLRLYAVAFALDAAGDIYLDARLPYEAVTTDGLDRLLGSVLDASDSSFNTLLELGFATSIRREYAWRLARGESTRNLDAFRGWLDQR